MVAPFAEIVGVAGNGLFLITTSSVELQDPLVIVQRKVISVLDGTLVTVDVRNKLLVIDALPEDPTKLHTPEAGDVGLLPASVNVDVLHNA